MRVSISIINHFLKDFYGKTELVGAEIGVEKGLNALNMLENIPSIKRLVLVDSYKTMTQAAEKYEAEARELLKGYSNRVEWVIKDSVEASKGFEDNTFDFIYIDGDHRYEGISADLRSWYPKMKKQGIFCGHDLRCNNDIHDAVVDFASVNSLDVYGATRLYPKRLTMANQFVNLLDWWIFT